MMPQADLEIDVRPLTGKIQVSSISLCSFFRIYVADQTLVVFISFAQ